MRDKKLLSKKKRMKKHNRNLGQIYRNVVLNKLEDRDDKYKG
jgi:hypothetical protein